MTDELSIIPQWLSGESGPPELRETACSLRIVVNGRTATTVEDRWSQSVREQVFVSAYPLALWLASSWWRLRWEPAPDSSPAICWRLAHEMNSVGSGYVWPRLSFESDGELVDVVCRRTNFDQVAPTRYLEDFRESVLAGTLELALDNFIELVLNRLASVGVSGGLLAEIWEDIKAERAEQESFTYRCLEARLGYEPDEAPTSAIEQLMGLAITAGESAAAEIAPACSTADPLNAIADVIHLAGSSGVIGKIELPPSLMGAVSGSDFQHREPWERGRWLASQARSAWGFSDGQVTDQLLAGIIGVQAATFEYHSETDRPLALAVRNGCPNKVKLLFRRRNHKGRRFEAARFLADILVAPPTDHWLPATDAKTARQKLQRAFATEFLCPIDALKSYLNGDLSEEAIDGAGEYFDISSLAVRSHLANHKLLPRF